MSAQRKATEHLIWANSEERQRALVILGWRVAPGQRATHHAHFAILMQWHGAGAPKMPAITQPKGQPHGTA